MRWQREDPQLALFGPEQRDLPSVEYMAVNARRIINTLPPSSRMPFRHTINAYRGCSHACTYCFARPTHEYLGLNGGADFERRLVVEVDSLKRLRAELADPRRDARRGRAPWRPSRRTAPTRPSRRCARRAGVPARARGRSAPPA